MNNFNELTLSRIFFNPALTFLSPSFVMTGESVRAVVREGRYG